MEEFISKVDQQVQRHIVLGENITLDDLYAKREIPKGAYLERRAKLRARLQEIRRSKAEKQAISNLKSAI